MRPFSEMLPLDEALARLRAAARPIERTERLRLADAAGRVMATDVTAPGDVPPFDRAAMDGYAVHADDTSAAAPDRPARLAIAAVTFAGHAAAPTLARGTCVEIATGAPLPPGADAVVMVEHTRPAPGGVLVDVTAPVRPRQHVGRRGADLGSGDVVVAAGSVLTPARLGAVAAAGVDAVEVFARPVVAVASSGNELVAPGSPLAAGQIHDVNRFTLPPIVSAHGGDPRVHPAIPDTLDALLCALDAMAGADVVVVSGGSSVGDRDLLVDAVRHRGDVLFHGIAVKPGKPTLLARVGDALLLGMPGNPTSCLSNAYVLLVPLLRRLARLPDHVPSVRELRLAADVTSPRDRHQFYPVRVDGTRAVPAFKGSGEITSLSGADGYLEIPAGVEHVAAGSTVRVVLF